MDPPGFRDCPQPAVDDPSSSGGRGGGASPLAGNGNTPEQASGSCPLQRQGLWKTRGSPPRLQGLKLSHGASQTIQPILPMVGPPVRGWHFNRTPSSDTSSEKYTS